MEAQVAWVSARCVLLLSRLLEAVPEPYILPDQLCSAVVKRAASSPFIYIFHSLNKETIDSFLISPLLDKVWNSFGNYWGKKTHKQNQSRDPVIPRVLCSLWLERILGKNLSIEVLAP